MTACVHCGDRTTGGWRGHGPVAGEVRAKARKYPVTTRTYTDSEGQKSHNLPTLSIRTCDNEEN